MRPILYDEFETEFASNGIGVLADTTDVTVEQSLNGILELTMKYPITGAHYSSIAQRSVILSSVDPISQTQPFRVYRITKPSKGIVTIYARHISYDLMGIVAVPFTANTADEALQNMAASAVTPCPFSFWTDKSTAVKLSSAVPKSIWNLLGGSEGSILDVYGGEYEFDRYAVKLWARRGADRGVSIRYGKNLTSLEQDENIANCWTGVYPYWLGQEGDLVQLPEKYILADGTFSHTKIMPLDFSAEWDEAPTEAQLRSRAQRYMADNDIGTPKVSITVEFISLEQTEEYKDIALLERVLLGDTVHVIFPKLGIDATARVVKAKWKPLLDRYDHVTIGSVKSSLVSTIVKQEQELQKKPDTTLVQQITEKLTKAITGALGGAVRLLDTNGDKYPDEIYVADDPDPDLAKIVWRWNYMGWAVSQTGYNGPFVMGATLQDGILAHSITAANLVAGTIKSRDGETFYLDLDNGILKIKAVSDLEDSTNQAMNEMAAELAVMADTISMNFSTATGQINAVDGALNEKFNQLYKYIKFSGETAITIGSGDSAVTIEIDNETGILFKRNGVVFGSWDGDNFYTGNIVIRVSERAQFGNFAFVPRSDGSLMFLKVT